MTRQFASHFVFLPRYGYLKQYAVRVKEGQFVSAFPLPEEIEGVEWFPGVIALLNDKEEIPEKCADIFQESNVVLQELPKAFCEETASSGRIAAYWFYPFDFTRMQPVGETRHRLLR